eukprot:12193844-Alexandrium_andersonii.AAC.1
MLAAARGERDWSQNELGESLKGESRLRLELAAALDGALTFPRASSVPRCSSRSPSCAER